MGDGVLRPVAGCRVLVVDDNPANTALVHRTLVRAGLPGVVEENDATAVAGIMESGGVDLVLLDLMMPGLDGFRVLEQVQRQAGATFLPVIVLTADDSHASVERALDLGAHDYLRKPFNTTELSLRVRNLLLRRLAYQELQRSRTLLGQRLNAFEWEPPLLNDNPDRARELIERAVADGGFTMALQPVVDLGTRRVMGYEALARFPQDELGPPGAWFAAARRLRLLKELETAAMDKALEHLASLGPEQLLAVNLSPDALVSGVADRLEGPEGQRIVIELTEHEPVSDYARLNEAIGRLQAAGVRLAVDDAGAGFASLRHILDLSPDIIKIDIHIIRGVDQDPGRAAIAEMLVRFAERTGVEVVAEGVETEAEAQALLALGPMLAQGYLFGRPEVP